MCRQRTICQSCQKQISYQFYVFFLLHGIRPGIKTTKQMQRRFSDDGFPMAENGVQVMNYPENTTNIILRPSGQTSFAIVDDIYEVMGLNQIIQTQEDIRPAANVIIVDNGQGSKFVYFKEIGFRRIQIAGLAYMIQVIDYWDPGSKQCPLVRKRRRPGVREGIEEDPGPKGAFWIVLLCSMIFDVESLQEVQGGQCVDKIFEQILDFEYDQDTRQLAFCDVTGMLCYGQYRQTDENLQYVHGCDVVINGSVVLVRLKQHMGNHALLSLKRQLCLLFPERPWLGIDDQQFT